MPTVIKVAFVFHMCQQCKWFIKHGLKEYRQYRWITQCFFVYLCVTRYDREETELTLDNVRHLVKLHDTAGQEDYERLRKMIYRDVRWPVILVMCSQLCLLAHSDYIESNLFSFVG